MRWLRFTTISLMTCGALAAASQPLCAQGDNGDSAPIHLGSVALSPAIRITNVGRDSNVFNTSKDDNPQSDMTATFSPAMDTWIRSSRFRLNARNQVDVFYFKELTSLRAVDNDHFARLDLMLNRVTPWVTGNFATTRHRQNLEIDAIARRRNDTVQAGTDVRLTAKTFVGIYGGRSHVEYETNSIFRNTDLARTLNHAGSVAGTEVKYAATPLTTFALRAEWQQDRFVSSSTRNSDSFRIMPSVEFKPLALVSGHAAVGFRTVRFLDGSQPKFNSTVASVDLQYTFRTRTQFGIAAQRDLEYSYLDTQQDYVVTGFSGSVTQRFGDSWDIRGSGGRSRLRYRRHDVTLPELPHESVSSVGFEVGYHIGHNRIGFNVDRFGRNSDLGQGRGYDRLRIGSSLTYVF